MRWVWLICSVLLLPGALLTVVGAWNVTMWKAAIVAGEYGHYAGVLAFLLICGALAHALVMESGRREWVQTGVTVAVALVAMGLYFSPVVFAGMVSRGLPRKLETTLSATGVPRSVLNYRRLFLPGPAAEVRPVTTHIFARAGTPEALALDVYEAATAGAPAPGVVMIHGGGWDSGSRTEWEAFNHWLANEGFAVVAIDYRLAPAHPWPAQRDDVEAALTWLQAHAEELRIDATRIVLMGRSAGAQIASAVGYGFEDPAIRGIVALYGVFDMEFVWSISREDDVLNSVRLMEQYLGGAPTAANQTAYDSASAQGMVRGPEFTPPTLLIHGAMDTLCWVEHSRRLARRLEQAGVPAIMVELPWATHAFDYNSRGPGGQLTAFSVRHFLRAVFTQDFREEARRELLNE